MPGTFGNQRGKRTSHRLVVEELGQAVVGGEFAIGETLPGDTDLAARFSVSRTVLREAMKTLAAKGLVVARARIGTRVLPGRTGTSSTATCSPGISAPVSTRISCVM